MAQDIDFVFRDWNVPGNPGSGEYEPEKPRIRALLKQIQAGAGNVIVRGTRAALYGVTPPNENYMGMVLNDPNATYNGYYYRSSGAWVYGRGFPDTFAEMTLAGSGTAQTGTVNVGVDPSEVEVFWADVGTDNTGPLTLNGKPVRSVAGNPLVAGEWTNVVLFVDRGSYWQMIIDANAAEIASQAAADATAAADVAETARDAAVAARDVATGAMSTVVVAENTFSTVAVAEAWTPVAAPDYIRTAGHTVAGIGGALYVNRGSSEPSHAGKLMITLDDGVTDVWYEIAEPILHLDMFGPVDRTGVSNNYSTLVAWGGAVLALGRPWYIAPGDYVVDGANTIELRTGGDARGVTLLVPRTNTTFRFFFTRDTAGSVVDHTSWTNLTRGRRDIAASNAKGKYLFLSSTEHLCDRLNVSEQYYLKREFIRVDESGNTTTPLVCTYSDTDALTVTAFEPSAPIEVNGLKIRVTGSGTEPSLIPRLAVFRDNVTFNGGGLTADSGLRHGPIVYQCADVVFNGFEIGGVTVDPGYAIQLADTIGLQFNKCHMINSVRAIAGRHNTDVHVNGGEYSVIDDHWGDRYLIEGGAVLYAPPGSLGVSFAGNDITIRDITVVGGSIIMGIRTDTPNIGGKVLLSNIKWQTYGASLFVWCFGFTSPNGRDTDGRTFEIPPNLSADVIIEDIQVETDIPVYFAYLGQITGTPNAPFKSVTVRGECRANTQLFGIYAVKNNAWQTDISHLLVNCPQMDTNGGYYVRVTHASANSGQSGAFKVVVDGGRSGRVQYTHLSVIDLKVRNAGVTTVDETTSTGSAGDGRYSFVGCDFLGGTISSNFRNIHIKASTFSGNMTGLDGTYITLIGNDAVSGVTGMPVDIRGNVVSPYA